jgi:hypothetical protein
MARDYASPTISSSDRSGNDIAGSGAIRYDRAVPTLPEIWRYWWAVLVEAGRIVVSGFGYGRPIQILTPILLAVVGIVRFQFEGRSSQEVFEYWDGIVAGLGSVVIVGTMIFLLALVCVPAKFARRQDQINDELRGRIEILEHGGDEHWLIVEPGALVIVRAHGSIGALMGGGVEHIEPGFYVIVQNTRLQNRLDVHVSLVPRLWGRPGASERAYEVTRLPEHISGGAGLSYGSIVFYLGGAFPPVIPFAPKGGDARRLTFRTTAKLEELQQSSFSLEFRDMLSDRPTIRQPIVKPDGGWRVHD